MLEETELDFNHIKVYYKLYNVVIKFPFKIPFIVYKVIVPISYGKFSIIRIELHQICNL